MKFDLVTFEQAKILRELGFPKSTFCPCYKENGELENGFTDLGQGIYSAPSLGDVAKWLRDKKNIHICPVYYKSESRNCEWYNCEVNMHPINQDADYKTYEEALSAGIDRSIGMLLHNLITENLKSVDMFPKNILPSSDIFDN